MGLNFGAGTGAIGEPPENGAGEAEPFVLVLFFIYSREACFEQGNPSSRYIVDSDGDILNIAESSE
jgi:hypothetical protein